MDEKPYHEEKIPCPACGKDAILRTIVREIPYYGDVVIISISCPHCGYRYRDVFVLKEHPEKVVKKKILTEEDLSSMLVLSSRAKVSIPELQMEILPGPAAKGRMLPVSALLAEFIDAIRFSISSAESEEEVERGKKLIERLKKELEKPSGELTIVVEDETGGSDIIPEAIWSRRAEEERK